MDFSNPASPMNPMNPLNPMSPFYVGDDSVVVDTLASSCGEPSISFIFMFAGMIFCLLVGIFIGNEL